MIEPLTPAVRLSHSREHLRLALHGTPAAAPSPRAPAQWWNELRTLPGASVVIDGVHAWWALHPLNATVRVATGAALDVVRPLARRHPLLAVLGAFMLGGLLVWSRPWRWALKPALFAGLLPQVVSAWMLQVQRQPPPPLP